MAVGVLMRKVRLLKEEVRLVKRRGGGRSRLPWFHGILLGGKEESNGGVDWVLYIKGVGVGRIMVLGLRWIRGVGLVCVWTWILD